jgi:hypothetical protein
MVSDFDLRIVKRKNKDENWLEESIHNGKQASENELDGKEIPSIVLQVSLDQAVVGNVLADVQKHHALVVGDGANQLWPMVLDVADGCHKYTVVYDDFSIHNKVFIMLLALAVDWKLEVT